MARKYQRRGQPSAPTSTTQGVEPVATAALNEKIEIMPAATRDLIEANKPKMVRMTLLKNYRPAGEVEVMGWNKEPVVRKTPAGKLVEVEAGGFIEDMDEEGNILPAPPKYAGTGFANKLLAGTVIRIGADEAKTMRANGIAEREIDD
jgi:hypothetical protein